MLKIDINPFFLFAWTFEFKPDENADTHTLIVIRSANPETKTTGDAWIGNHVKNSNVDELISLLQVIRNNRYSAGVRVINDGTLFVCESHSFNPFEFQLSEEGRNADNLFNRLLAVCRGHIPDDSFHAAVAHFK